ncbi:MAG: GNAT family N-acetyltransferase [Bacteroidia bacterium]|nr:GNAT family N-acetyltransferase [Bacteroidia bacterium]
MIETKRLLIRSFALTDVDSYAELVSDPEVMRFIGNGEPQSQMEAKNYVEECMTSFNELGWSRYAVTLKDTDEFIGFCGFKKYRGEIDLGWRYHKKYWGKGFGSEAAEAVLEYGFTHLHFPKIVCIVYTENIASIRIIEKLNMQLETQTTLNGFDALQYFLTNPTNTLRSA